MFSSFVSVFFLIWVCERVAQIEVRLGVKLKRLGGDRNCSRLMCRRSQFASNFINRRGRTELQA